MTTYPKVLGFLSAAVALASCTPGKAPVEPQSPEVRTQLINNKLQEYAAPTGLGGDPLKWPQAARDQLDAASKLKIDCITSDGRAFSITGTKDISNAMRAPQQVVGRDGSLLNVQKLGSQQILRCDF